MSSTNLIKIHAAGAGKHMEFVMRLLQIVRIKEL